MDKKFEKYVINPFVLNELLKKTKFNFFSYDSLINENDVFEKMQNNKINNYQRTHIKNWADYENNEKDLSQKDFHNFFLMDIPPNELIILLTHEGIILRKCVFKFYSAEFYAFSDLYEDYFSMEFFQLSYYLLIYPGLNMLRFLDEDGGINEYRIPK